MAEDHSGVDSLFNCGLTLSPVPHEIQFTPSITGWTAVTDETYNVMKLDKGINILYELPIEAFRYYTSCMYWLRVIGLKMKQDQLLSGSETVVCHEFIHKSFSIPEPIFLGLKAIGRVKTRTGEVLVPTFPRLPITVIQNIPGTLGLASVENHNIYEEHPVIGIAYQGCYERSQTIHNHIYQSVVAPSGTVATRNLQGYGLLKSTRKEAIEILYHMGFQSGQELPSTIANTGLSFDMLILISNILEKTKTFKLYRTNPLNITVKGSIGQIIEAWPTDLVFGTTASDTTVIIQSFLREASVPIGISLCYGLNQFKSNLVENDASVAIIPWSCIGFKNENTPPPENWSERRNERRNLPERYHTCLFQCEKKNLAEWRREVIVKLAQQNLPSLNNAS